MPSCPMRSMRKPTETSGPFSGGQDRKSIGWLAIPYAANAMAIAIGLITA